MSSPLDRLPEAERSLLQPSEPPRRANAMKAVLTDARFSDPDWIFERKLDGIRCIAIRSGAQPRMLSRNDLSLNGRYPELAEALASQRCERFAPQGSRTELGALLLGYHVDGELHYAGKVGTGFDRDTLGELGAELRRLSRKAPPFADPSAIRERGVTWMEPRLVAEIGFAEWTRHGRLRHPRFLGLRADKQAREVVREG